MWLRVCWFYRHFPRGWISSSILIPAGEISNFLTCSLKKSHTSSQTVFRVPPRAYLWSEDSACCKGGICMSTSGSEGDKDCHALRRWSDSWPEFRWTNFGSVKCDDVCQITQILMENVLVILKEGYPGFKLQLQLTLRIVKGLNSVLKLLKIYM